MPSILRLLDPPFGPYPEDELLSDKFQKGKIFKLRSFYMKCSGSPIGLDETEFIATPPQRSRIACAPTEFYGILEIESLDWLSPLGRDWIQYDLRMRDLVIHSEMNQSGLTLSKLYGYTKHEGSRIRVWIQGIKSMSAQFSSENHRPHLIIHSKNRCGRIYSITSLDVGTFQSSQNFFTRYRLWALINEIIETDPVRTPLRKRTVDWLVDQYRRRLRRRQQSRRFFEAPADTDISKSRRRFLRHVPRAELLSIFAAHANWLLAQQLAPSTSGFKKVNIEKWLIFCRRATVARHQANHNNISWGMLHGDTVHEQFLDLTQFGETRQFWEKKIKQSLKKSKKLMPTTRRCPSPVNTIASVKHRQQTFIYDSDFSEASTSAYSDPSDREYNQPRQLGAPIFYSLRPTIPSGRFVWGCPSCSYTINFLALSQENTSQLPVADVQALLSKSWSTLKEEWVQAAFLKMVKLHYATHRP